MAGAQGEAGDPGVSLTFKLDGSAARDTATLRRQLERDLSALAKKAEIDAQTMAEIGASAGIYDTEEGHYQRTEHYLESIYARASVSPAGVILEVGDTAEYASDLEYGALGSEISQAVAEKMAEALGSQTKVLYLGRTGHLYYQANPAITRAAVFAGLRMTENFAKLLAGRAASSLQLGAAAD